MKEKCEALLHGTFKLDKAMLDLMSGPMLSEANRCFVRASLDIIKLPAGYKSATETGGTSSRLARLISGGAQLLSPYLEIIQVDIFWVI